MKLPKALIITDNPTRTKPSGVRTMTQVAYRALTADGFETDLVYAGFMNVSQGSRVRRALSRIRRIKTREYGTYDDMPVIAVPPLPSVSAPALQNQWFSRQVRPLIRDYDRIITVGATAHLALSLINAQIPFLSWIAVTLRDELEGKASAGNHLASRRLKSPFWPLEEYQEKQCLAKAPLILTISEYSSQRVLELAPQAVVKTIPVPVDITLYVPDESIVRRNPPMIIFAGRYSDPRKNIPLLLDAFHRVLQHMDAQLVLIGDTPPASLLELCKRHDLTNRVQFIEWLPCPEEVAQWYHQASLFVLPSLQEGLGIVALEAMASGLPVVSTRCGGPEAILMDSGAGILVDHDPSVMGNAIIELLSNASKMQHMSQAGIEYARSYLSFATFAPRFRAALDSVFALNSEAGS